MSDIVETLREYSRRGFEGVPAPRRDVSEAMMLAADEIERLRSLTNTSIKQITNVLYACGTGKVSAAEHERAWRNVLATLNEHEPPRQDSEPTP